MFKILIYIFFFFFSEEVIYIFLRRNCESQNLRSYIIFFFIFENGNVYEREKYKSEKYAFAVRLSLSAHLLSWGTRRIKSNEKINKTKG